MQNIDNELIVVLVEALHRFVVDSPKNSLGLKTGEPAFDKPLIGFSSGMDPLYQKFRSHIG